MTAGSQVPDGSYGYVTPPLKMAFLDRATLDMGDVDFATLEALGDLRSADYTDPTDREQLVTHVGDAEAIVVNKVTIDRGAFDAIPGVAHVAVIATGVNNVDLDTARDRAIAVSNVAGYARYAVPQHAFALILALASRTHHYARDVEAGDWAAASGFTLLRYPTFELAGKTLGVVGWGATARTVAQIGAGFGMRVMVWNRRPVEAPPHRVVALNTLLAESDVVTIHVPLAPETAGLIGADELARMKRSALVVNTARGGIVDEAALIAALESGEIAGAGLDVLTEEPPRSSPVPVRAARGDLNLIVTPHAAWSAVEARQRLVNEVAANLAAWRRGEQRNRVV